MRVLPDPHPADEGREERDSPPSPEGGAPFADPALRQVLARAAPERQRRRRSVGIAVAGLALAIALALWLRGDDAPAFVTAPVVRGDLVARVTATGTLEPVSQVDVGAEVSGRIAEVFVDYNDRVERGDLLAVFDTAQLEANVLQAQASLAAARAALAQARATAALAERRHERAVALSLQDVLSSEQLDAAEAEATRARAAVASARAQVSVAEARLDADRTTLAKAEIRSPIDGVVIAREVEPGQTVAAAFQTPLLFTLAEDLSRMELHVDVDEADIGQVEVGQQATFRVDAYPDRRFTAEITSLRNAPRTVQEVVTYEALLSVDNPERLLRPGMTATVEITTRMREDALLVENGALRFTPPAEQDGARERVPRAGPEGPRVWALQDGVPVAIPVRTGLTDGSWTEILEGDVEAGQPLLVDVERPEA